MNRIRERRIEQEIVIDAYTSDERALSWYYYLEENRGFPFMAKCVAARLISPLKKGEEVGVIGMAKEDDCMREMLVLVRFAGCKLGVPLAQLEPIGADAAPREAANDWRYWVAMGYGF
ncbi:MAG: calcium-binding protein [Betaproteobacteria bacterium]